MDDREGACCGNPRRTVSDLFDRGYKRNRLAPFSITGASLHDANDLSAAFSLTIEHDTIKAVRFQVSTCITLIAYSELLAQLAAQRKPRDAARISEAELVAALPDVPTLKRDRAILAVNAFRAALAAASRFETGEAA
ncbi:MAG TPA: iron-sulfur cluster assembly scaffold protein [Xanthobacteraceae bacterium]|nr:iron-sulfur cluster assembly scaffold protein [Xanthobacteraceae bacterium]